jgi:DNA-binding NtrC family response regulator
MSTRVLLVDDDASLCETFGLGLRKRGCDVAWRTSASEALDLLQADAFDVVVTDVQMRGINGIELCERIVANRDVPVLVLTAFGNLDSAIAAIHAGAYDFINKPVELDVLAIAVERAANHQRLREEVKRLRVEVGQSPRFDELVGQSPSMQAVYGLIERVGAADATVLITGESGTGKEVVARAIHARSPRRGGPLVAINCAAMPENLLES